MSVSLSVRASLHVEQNTRVGLKQLLASLLYMPSSDPGRLLHRVHFTVPGLLSHVIVAVQPPAALFEGLHACLQLSCNRSGQCCTHLRRLASISPTTQYGALGRKACDNMFAHFASSGSTHTDLFQSLLQAGVAAAGGGAAGRQKPAAAPRDRAIEERVEHERLRKERAAEKLAQLNITIAARKVEREAEEAAALAKASEKLRLLDEAIAARKLAEQAALATIAAEAAAAASSSAAAARALGEAADEVITKPFAL